jgi:glycosyltransferase involved in cell wall biosynthesis
MRLLAVLPRYGAVVGGAEQALRLLLTHCAADDEVEVATTCAVDHHHFANDLPAGTETIDGRAVRRFRVSNVARGDAPGFAGGDYLDAVRRLASSVWSADLHRFLVREGERFDRILLTPYLFGVTFWGAQVHPDRSLLLPCLHDEPEAHLPPVRALLAGVRGCIFHSSAEAALAATFADVREGHVVGLPFPPVVPLDPAEVAAFRERYHLERPYLVYCGRIEEGKRVDRLCELVGEARLAGVDVDLALVGHGPYRPPAFVRSLGYLADHERRLAMAGAVALATASVLESFSLVVLEAWQEGTPAISDAACGAIAEHVHGSGGAGAEFDDARSFTAAVRRFLDARERERAGALGAAYVRERFAPEAVRERFRIALDANAACGSPST